MFKLPVYDVIVWLYSNEFGKKLEEELLSSIGIIPYESFESDGVLDMHWGFEDWEEAVHFSKKLKRFINNSNLILLKASNLKNIDASITYKDERTKNG
ncbi:MAG: hypothetical protein MUO88_03325 [Desulfobacterales bacterium]|nr:hypothetical protein [Desulfobacterales bacterium]